MDSIRLLREDVIKLQNADMATRDQINKMRTKIETLSNQLDDITDDIYNLTDPLRSTVKDDTQGTTDKKLMKEILRKGLDKKIDDLFSFIQLKAEVSIGYKGVHRGHLADIKKSIGQLEELARLYDSNEGVK